MTLQSDRSLVEAVVRGDRSLFAVLVERYSRTVVGTAMEILHDKHAAEDVAQDAFVVGYERLNSLRDGAAFGCWLMRITRRIALRVVRQQRRERTLQVATVGAIADRNDPLGDRSKVLLKLVQRLPEHERLVVMLKYFEDQSVHDISRVIGQPVSTVTKKLTRARRRLHNWFKESEQ